MKRILSFVIVSIVLLSIMDVSTVFGENVPNYYIDGLVKCSIIFDIEDEKFYDLVTTSETSIYDITTHWDIYRACLTDQGNEAIEKLKFKSDGSIYRNDLIEPPWGGWWIGSKIVGLLTYDTINYFGAKENIQNILAENNVQCNVKDYVILSIYGCDPIIIWVETEQGDYYISFQKDEEQLTENDSRYNEENHFVYDVYDSEEFLRLITEQNLQILNNGEKITNENYYATTRGEIEYISLRTMLEAFGSEITWNDEEQTIIFTCGEDKYKFSVKDNYASYDTIQVSEKGGEYKLVPWSDRVEYWMVDDRTIIFGDCIKEFAELFGKEVKIDYDNLTIDFVDM